MTLKSKLISVIISVCLMIALLSVGIWAVNSGSVNIGGTVSFTASDVYAKITGSITGAKETVNLSTLNYSATSEPTTAELSTWQNNALNFTSDNLITMTITVQNLSDQRSLFVTITDTVTTATNITKTLKQGTIDYVSGSEYELAKSTTVTFAITLKVTDQNKSATANFGYQVDLRDANAPKPPVDVNNLSYLTFSYDDSTMSASLTKCTDTAITSVDIPARIQKGNNIYDVTSIADGNMSSSAFNNCESLTSVTIPKGITKIGNYAFYNCRGLTGALTIPDSVKSIGERAFSSCNSLTSVTIGSGVTSIGYSAFSGCTGLTSLSLGNGVTSIGAYAFDGCYALTSITIPDSVTSIGESAFWCLESLAEVTLGANIETININAFLYCNSLKTVYINGQTTFNNITSSETSAGSIFNKTEFVYVKDDVTVSSTYFTEVESDVEGYKKYTEKLKYDPYD